MLVPFQTLGISQSVYEPLWAGSLLLDDQFARKLPQYSHEDAAFLGWDRAGSSGGAGRETIDDWINNGLGRRLVTFNHAQQPIWSGFANLVRAQVGPASYSAGPLLGVTNRGSVMFSRLYDDVSPPVVGSGESTPIAEDADSQLRYGILETVWNGGTMTLENAEQQRDILLEERRLPDKSQESANLPGEGTLSIEWLGFVHFLGRYVYNDLTNLTTTVSDKLLDVLAAEPNGLFSTDYSQVAENLFLTTAYEDQNRYGLDILQSLTALGDINLDRHLFMVRANQRIYYRPIPASTEVTYLQYLTDYGHEYRLAGNNAVVQPWDLEPGKWLLIADFAPYSPQPYGKKNLRLQFIERVSFSTPRAVRLAGAKVEAGPQLLAQLGLGGMSG
jgi:hypothetical protein